MAELEEAVAGLLSGGVVVVPTDTVYGLATLPTEAGIRALFELKARSADKAIPILASSRAQAASVASFTPQADRLAAAWWPGALTLVTWRHPGFIIDLGGRDDATVAVRVPRSGVLTELLSRTGPLAVTSANLSGQPSANSAQEARAIFGASVAAYLDDGPGGGEASTIVDVTGVPTVLRRGALSETDLF